MITSEALTFDSAGIRSGTHRGFSCSCHLLTPCPTVHLLCALLYLCTSVNMFSSAFRSPIVTRRRITLADCRANYNGTERHFSVMHIPISQLHFLGVHHTSLLVAPPSFFILPQHPILSTLPKPKILSNPKPYIILSSGALPLSRQYWPSIVIVCTVPLVWHLNCHGKGGGRLQAHHMTAKAYLR